MEVQTLGIVFAPLIGSLIAGLFGKKIGRLWSHRAAIAGVSIAFLLSLMVFKQVVVDGVIYNEAVYTWVAVGDLRVEIGFLIDRLSALMMVVVTFVSLMVHIYTIGYMADDPGYQRFFSYIALFTFSMLMLVMANNFLQLFFGWEAVGLVSYLLIGFWYKRESAIYASLKAFLVNRIGDIGFLLGIACVLMYTGSLDYVEVFTVVPTLTEETLSVWPGTAWSVLTVIGILLFIGAMGKSAQAPLHVWLPDSMEGPTPISALIHAATMVTAGIFMVARMSPIYELSEIALSVILVIGAITAFFMGLIGIVQNDIKRVIAYSTLSQLGYMTVALGVSAYAAGIFHLMTHAFFKALLFLGAGSVIIAMHHEQDMRKMGGLKKYMPVTYWTAIIGALALIGFPGFSGFFSKDSIIEAVHASQLPGAGFAYAMVVSGVFVTAFYTFRMLFLTFHGEERMDQHTRAHLKESPAVVTVPLVLLAIPSVVAGIFIEPILFGGFFGEAVMVSPAHNVLAAVSADFHGAMAFALHGFQGLPFILAMVGVVAAWYLYLKRPQLPKQLRSRFGLLYWALSNKYGFDRFNEIFFAGGARQAGRLLSQLGDRMLIDGFFVNGTARVVGVIAQITRYLQSGYLFHYAFAMILGLLFLIGSFVIYGG
ncbi:NADH dehydrogenase subunit L [Nitrosococcus oceani ATCC 19707]|uniref:NADH dehydrogenase subunit L n=2 Tax=Nitrosococcus oceani TaxID=1229 RepID=Q3J839_NITOC|nr:NADH-quinone oxidoreductase subunit L [Nitrosococcus oceani]ABA59007.1 NADH dehydrogenase subunit L [Nitrosococcus oceani ATCC 19707]EDZ65349.1 proton-translocating NADH-quinone oxidoreductase, chain L subfamily [Nitrosococcus oceani AFC27]KFI18529.1 NADH:ubiquinone oxidoreductase subunit L [Nitrosococcus oceani C-27]GEM21231.1 NADH-quinone oxidoreductase subunit L [Nitrosococcus oceani]